MQPGYVRARFEAMRAINFPDASPEIVQSLWFAFWTGMATGCNPCMSDVDRQVLNHQLIVDKPTASPPKDGVTKPNLQPSFN